MRFDQFMEGALSGPEGFFTSGRGAGRRADFLTSPEVGPLFGAVLARALDAWWVGLGRPEPFVVIEGGAGRGALAAAVLAAGPACRDTLRYVAVERAPALRARLPAGVEAAGDLPTPIDVAVVVANELLDNLPVRLLERRAGGWAEVHVDPAAGAEVLLDAPAEAAAEASSRAPEAPVGGRVPLQREAAAWLGRALGLARRGRVVVVDYMDTTASMAGRPWRDWLRTYRGHARGGHPLDAPGAQDITCEVAADQLAAVAPPTSDRTQADFLAAHGLDELVAAARAAWRERAHVGDLAAVRARSRVGEAAALTDSTGLGAFRVLEWELG